jgi:tetratricopeptide (TPR) repeat protein
VAFSPDGTRVITGSGDLTAKVWDARTTKPLLELKGHTGGVLSVAFNSDGTRILTGSYDRTAKVWDARTGTPLLELKGHTNPVYNVAFAPGGTRIVTEAGEWNKPVQTKVWDARSGTEVKGEAIPPTIANNWTSPDGRFFAHPEGNRVELIPLKLDEAELSHRLLHTQPNLGRYREGYQAARAARDDFAARFYLGLLPAPERARVLDEAIAGCRTAVARAPNNAGAHAALGDVLKQKGQLHEAIACYTKASALEPKQAGHRYHAACSAALAVGQCEDAKRDSPQRRALRRRALTWLRAELTLWTLLFASDEVGRSRLAQVLSHWQQDADLAGIRDKAALDKLSAEEHAACVKLWADVAALLKKAEAPKKEPQP